MLFSFDIESIPLPSSSKRAERVRQVWLSNASDRKSCQFILDQQHGSKLFDAISGNSPYLSRIIEQEADFALWLFQNGPEKTLNNIFERLDAWPDRDVVTHEFMAFLRKEKKKAALVIAVADITRF